MWFHFGGYARKTLELTQFIGAFEKRHGLRLDWIYVAKMMFGIFERARRREFLPGTRVVAVITGSPRRSLSDQNWYQGSWPVRR